jgi:hypothetical protein
METDGEILEAFQSKKDSSSSGAPANESTATVACHVTLAVAPKETTQPRKRTGEIGNEERVQAKRSCYAR